MSILIGRHDFEGPPEDARQIPSKAGLYAILIEQNEDLLLVEIHATTNLNLTLANRVLRRNDRSVVYLVVEEKTERTEILNELLREFEFEYDEPVPGGRGKRTETNSGIAVSL